LDLSLCLNAKWSYFAREWWIALWGWGSESSSGCARRQIEVQSGKVE
jgi:hypothetical protein